MEKSELSRAVPQDEVRNGKPENRGHTGPALTSRLPKTAQGQTVSAWGQPIPSRGLLFYCSKYVQETDGFWIRISPKCPHIGWLYRRCPQTPKASQVWKELRNNGQRTQSAFAFMSGRFRVTAVGGSLLPLPKRPEPKASHREAKSRRTEARLVWGVCINKKLYTVTLRRIPAKRRIHVHRKVLTSFQLPPSKFFLVCGIRKSAGTQLPNSEHDPARIPKPRRLGLNLILTRHWGRLCWEK